jgi:hypothetical protein
MLNYRETYQIVSALITMRGYDMHEGTYVPLESVIQLVRGHLEEGVKIDSMEDKKGYTVSEEYKK